MKNGGFSITSWPTLTTRSRGRSHNAGSRIGQRGATQIQVVILRNDALAHLGAEKRYRGLVNKLVQGIGDPLAVGASADQHQRVLRRAIILLASIMHLMSGAGLRGLLIG